MRDGGESGYGLNGRRRRLYYCEGRTLVKEEPRDSCRGNSRLQRVVRSKRRVDFPPQRGYGM